MSSTEDFDYNNLDMRKEFARIDRDRAETLKLFAEQGKLAAEQMKLTAEAAKLSRDRFFAPVVVFVGVVAVIINGLSSTIHDLVLRAY